MPILFLAFKLLNAQERAAMAAAITIIETILMDKSQNLSDEERKEFGSVNEQNKLLINKVLDFYKKSPGLASPDVDWTKFQNDYDTREFADKELSRLQSLVFMLSNVKIVHDYDNFQAALTDYKHTRYKSTTNTPGYASKAKEIKQFFPNSGKKKVKANGNGADSDNTPPPSDTPPVVA